MAESTEVGRWTIRQDMLDIISGRDFKIDTPAERTFKALSNQIIHFESGLNDNEEIGGAIVSGPDSKSFYILGIECVGHDLIVFHGLNEHLKTMKLMQHVSQLSVLFTALPKRSERVVRIGFTLLQESS